MGIENLKRLLDFLFAAGGVALTLDKDNDGKIEIGEIFAVLTSSFVYQIPKIFTSVSVMKDELRDLSAEELQVLADYCREKDYFPANLDELEDFIKDTLNWIAYNARYTERAVGFFKK